MVDGPDQRVQRRRGSVQHAAGHLDQPVDQEVTGAVDQRDVGGRPADIQADDDGFGRRVHALDRTEADPGNRQVAVEERKRPAM
ncbi:hypothetical protein Prum_020340 [Phytohabitans rumicis]|uniref:Uncharacterized protein n=1 Tax=Phytohabitans rumicis TaxID=1076125 RepID=A0A6V8KTE5_9ACTN|nr:hypothetical protein Prum_020340 [Phytohabitans rumicis]